MLCRKCVLRFEEYDRNRAAADAGFLEWNVSQHDPFWRGWLTSRELFDAIRETAPRIGKLVHRAAGGDVFECLRGELSCWLQVWLSEDEVIVAYPTAGELYNWPDDPDGFHQFDDWICHLRESPSLELGRVRDRCCYGVLFSGHGKRPKVKWAQAGDWASAARSWHAGARRELAPWT